MMDRLRRSIRRLVEKTRGSPRAEGEARTPEPSEAPPPDEPQRAQPPDDYSVPVTSKERRHDGWSEIRPRRPGEDTDMGRDMIPDITDPGDLVERRG